jgi:hypothetical protein
MRPPDAPQIAAALYGAWRLLRLEPDGLQAFRVDPEAFWQSFFAALIVLPGYAILVSRHLGEPASAAALVSAALIHVFAYAMNWTAFPLVTYYAAESMDRAANWMGFVIALNWSKVLQIAIYLPLVLAADTGFFGQGGGAVLTVAGFVAVLVYQWFVTRAALDIAGAAAAGLTVLDVVIGLLITTLTEAAVAG